MRTPRHEFKITVAKDPEVAAKAKRDEYTREMHKQLDELDAKYEELKATPPRPKVRPRRIWTSKLEEAKVKRDAAAKKLEELKDAAPDRWEKIKEGVGNAFDDLKKIFK